MNVKACATSDVAAAWNQIDWQKAESYVKKLQKRIVKAQMEGRQGKVNTVAVDPLFLRQSISSKESNRKQR